MVLDEIGNQDYITIIVSKEPLDIKAINTAMNTNKSGDYKKRVEAALGNRLLQGVNFTSANGKIAFQTETTEKNAVAMVIEINKQ